MANKKEHYFSKCYKMLWCDTFAKDGLTAWFGINDMAEYLPSHQFVAIDTGCSFKIARYPNYDMKQYIKRITEIAQNQNPR